MQDSDIRRSLLQMFEDLEEVVDVTVTDAHVTVILRSVFPGSVTEIGRRMKAVKAPLGIVEQQVAPELNFPPSIFNHLHGRVLEQVGELMRLVEPDEAIVAAWIDVPDVGVPTVFLFSEGAHGITDAMIDQLGAKLGAAKTPSHVPRRARCFFNPVTRLIKAQQEGNGARYEEIKERFFQSATPLVAVDTAARLLTSCRSVGHLRGLALHHPCRVLPSVRAAPDGAARPVTLPLPPPDVRPGFFAAALRQAVAHGQLSHCRKSHRGAIAWYAQGKTFTFASGTNMPLGRPCDGTAGCAATCPFRCVHAEVQALNGMRRGTFSELQLLHVKVADGKPVPSGGPSCADCSKFILLFQPRVAAVWLLHADGWRNYDPEEFHELSVAGAAAKWRRS